MRSVQKISLDTPSAVHEQDRPVRAAVEAREANVTPSSVGRS